MLPRESCLCKHAIASPWINFTSWKAIDWLFHDTAFIVVPFENLQSLGNGIKMHV